MESTEIEVRYKFNAKIEGISRDDHGLWWLKLEEISTKFLLGGEDVPWSIGDNVNLVLIHKEPDQCQT